MLDTIWRYFYFRYPIGNTRHFLKKHQILFHDIQPLKKRYKTH